MVPNMDATGDGLPWFQWAISGVSALGLCLIGLVYQSGIRGTDAARTAAADAKDLAIAAKETAKAEAVAATEALRREVLTTINTLANNTALAQDRVAERFNALGREVSDFRVDSERRFATREDFKELRDELQDDLKVQLAALEHRLDSRLKEINDTLRAIQHGNQGGA